jgi:hypothetical protein
MRGAIPPLPKYSLMAWCLVKHRDNFTFTLQLIVVWFVYGWALKFIGTVISFSEYAVNIMKQIGYSFLILSVIGSKLSLRGKLKCARDQFSEPPGSNSYH